MKRNLITKKLQDDCSKALKEKDKAKVGTMRMLLSALKNAAIEARGELNEDQEIAVLSGYARRCRESIGEFEKGGRDDLVAKERAELEIVMSYLPEQMSEEEIAREIRAAIADLGAEGPRDAGRVIGTVMKKYRGKVDGGVVNRMVSEMLQKG